MRRWGRGRDEGEEILVSEAVEVAVVPVGPTTEMIDPRVALAEQGWDDAEGDGGKPAGRSGRNMAVAALAGLAMLGVVVGAAWFHPAALAAVVYAASLGAIIEWRRALTPQGRHLPLVPLVAATVGMGFATWYALAEGLVVAALVGCLGLMAWRIVDERIENTLADSLSAILTLLWIPFLASFFLLMAMADGGWVRVVIVVLAISANDTGALLVGMLWGRHKLAPRISPKKTWEGGVGGVLLGAGAATGAAYLLLDGRWWIGAIVGVVATVAGVMGDLAESVVKRDIQVKDMSQAIPGHGGIMDRLDSALFAAPAAYLVFAALLGTT